MVAYRCRSRGVFRPQFTLIPGKALQSSVLAGAKVQGAKDGFACCDCELNLQEATMQDPLRNQLCSLLHMRRGGMTISSGCQFSSRLFWRRAQHEPRLQAPPPSREPSPMQRALSYPMLT
jgi:hypothetical protein